MTLTFEGRAWVVTNKTDDDGKHGELINDIDTDQIFHNRYLAITEIEKMGQYAFDNLEGWKHFAKEAKPGDIVIVGENMGSGSSRQQAVDCFVSLGVSCLLAKSFGAIYKRNAINSGFPILIMKELDLDKVKDDENIVVDVDSCEIKKGEDVVGKIAPMTKVQMDIYKAGNLFKFGKTLE